VLKTLHLQLSGKERKLTDGQKALSDRPDRETAEYNSTSSSVLRRPWKNTEVFSDGNPERRPLYSKVRLCVAAAAARFSSVAERLLLFYKMEE
jgi:hypothetical protein